MEASATIDSAQAAIQDKRASGTIDSGRCRWADLQDDPLESEPDFMEVRAAEVWEAGTQFVSAIKAGDERGVWLALCRMNGGTAAAEAAEAALERTNLPEWFGRMCSHAAEAAAREAPGRGRPRNRGGVTTVKTPALELKR